MKKHLNVLGISLISIMIITSCGPDKKYSSTKIKSQEDSVSYFLGLNYGYGLKQAKIDSVFNYNAFLKGITEAVTKDSLPVSQMEMQMFLNQYFSIIQTKQVEKQYKQQKADNKAFLENNAKNDSVVTLPSGLQYKIIKQGTGNKPTIDSRVKVNYIGTLIDGSEFDNSYKRNQPYEFGVKEVIPGWVEVLQLMPVGSRWKVYVPENLAYGSQARGEAIKPFSTLIFEMELLEIVPPAAPGK